MPDDALLTIPAPSGETAAHLLEERLALTGASFEALSTGLPSAVYTDAPGNLLRVDSVSSEIEELTGRSPSEIITLPGGWIDIVHPDDRAAVIAENARAAVAPPFRAEYRIIHRDGTVRWIRDVTSKVYGANGSVQSSVGVLTDITQVRQAQEFAAESSQRIRDNLDQLPVAVYIYGRTSGQMTETYAINTHMIDLLGYTAEEWKVGRTFWFAIMHPDDRERVMVTEQSIVDADGSFASMVYRLTAKDGTVHWIRDDSRRIDDRSTDLEVWQGVFTDITTQVEAAEAARASDIRFRSLIQHSL
ncbi:MAG: PAS domain-containing protein, partial [Thermomicrobiales bacterium]